MKSILLLAVCAAVLTGCAGNEAAVRVQAARGFGEGTRTYAFADDAQRTADGDDRRLTSAIARRLAEFGFIAAPEQSARYRLALSHDTRPASVAVGYAACSGGAPCGVPEPGSAPGFPWPGAAYVHSLTLRFFDRADGREVYRVSAAKRDREPGADLAADDLVAGALARLPFVPSPAGASSTGNAGDGAQRADWRVKLRKDRGEAEARVTGIALRQE